tara:strand:+ start:144 stop:1124 length:981 start_codon:yes stop_codon:yes gene_type:complete
MFRLMLLVLAASFAGTAWSQDCRDTGVSYKIRKASTDARMSAFLNLDDQAMWRNKLADYRTSEKSCRGQNTLDLVIAMIDVNQGEVQEAVLALPIILRSDLEDEYKSLGVRRLIGRLYQAGATGQAIALARGAAERFPETPSFKNVLALLLAADDQLAQSKSIADAAFTASLKSTPTGIVPQEGWIRLAIAHASGDQDDIDATLARLLVQTGGAGDALSPDIRQDITVPIFLAARFDGPMMGEPVTPPRPRYPQRMAVKGRAGTCDVHFDVSLSGLPESVVAVCDDDGFKQEAERAVSEARYKPLIVDGKPRRRIGVTYPLEFKLQ